MNTPVYDVRYWVPVAHYCLLQCNYSSQKPQGATGSENNAISSKKPSRLAAMVNPFANDISIRSFVNSGFLSILLVALCDADDKIRAQVLVCLDMVLMLLRTQTHEVDSLFRERPQIIHLLEFVKNSMHVIVDDGGSLDSVTEEAPSSSTGKKRHADQFLHIVIPRLPVTMSLLRRQLCI